MGDHVPPPSRHAEEDTIEQIVETDRHEAEFGRKVLLELSKVDNTPKLTFRNVIRSTDGLTILNCIALTMCYTSAIMEYNVPPSQIPFIIADLGRPELASWLSTASTVATCATLPTMSSFTDVFGRRYALLFGCGLGTAGALLSGFAPSTKVIMVGQALSGAGVGFTFISAAALAEIVPAFTRPFWGTLQHTFGATGQILGPIYAGAIVRHYKGGWRWAFYINAILYGITFIMIFFIYRPKSRIRALGLTKREVAKRFDYLGLLLFIGGTVCFLTGLSWGGDRRYGWHSPHAIVPTVIGCLVLVVILPVYEAFVVKWPLIDRRLFKSRNFVCLNIQTFVVGFVQFACNVYFPQLILAFWEKDPLMIGVDRAPLFGGILFGQTFSGLVFQKTGTYRWAYIIYAFLLALGPAILAVLRPTQSISVPLGLSVITGLGVGGATQLAVIAIQYSIPQQDLGLGMGSLNTLRSFGGAVAVAIYNSILRSKQNRDLPGAISSAAIKAGAPQSELAALVKATMAQKPQGITAAAGGDMAVVSAVVKAYKMVVSDSYRLVFLATIPFGILSLSITLLLREVTEYMSDETVFGVKRGAVPTGHQDENVDEQVDLEKVSPPKHID